MKIVALTKRVAGYVLMLSRKSRREKKIVKIFQWSLTNAFKDNIYTWKTAPKTKLKQR